MKTVVEGVCVVGFVALLIWAGSEEAGELYCELVRTWILN